MTSMRHHVTFRFRLPPALAMRAPLGFWPRSPRGCTLDVGDHGNVLVSSVDHSEIFARKQVLQTAGAFLRTTDPVTQPETLLGELSAPSCRERLEVYSITLGAAVSIARSDPHRAPVLTFKRESQLSLLNLGAD
jgi:hypothetical protein